jgi:flavin-binding protein dodecin
MVKSVYKIIEVVATSTESWVAAPSRHRRTSLTTTVIEGADVVAVDTEIIGSS